MAKTKNIYDCPVDLKETTGMFFNKSPAHSRNYKNGIYKNAVDFICPLGTQVKAAADGKVIEIVSSNDMGGADELFDNFANYIEIEHPNGEYSEYEHLNFNGVVVRVGDEVKMGQLIGYSGATGWLANLGPHLHFMVGKYGKTICDYKTLEIAWLRNFI